MIMSSFTKMKMSCLGVAIMPFSEWGCYGEGHDYAESGGVEAVACNPQGFGAGVEGNNRDSCPCPYFLPLSLFSTYFLPFSTTR